MFYKVDGTTLVPAPVNFTLPDGRRVFNFNQSIDLLNENGYTNEIVDGDITSEQEWYEQSGLIITRHPAKDSILSDEDEIEDSEALKIITGEEAGE